MNEALYPTESARVSMRLSRVSLVLVGYSALLMFAFVFGRWNVVGDYEKQFWVLSGVVGIHQIIEIVILERQGLRRFLLQPVVLGSIVIFLLQLGGLTSFLLMTKEGGFMYLYNSKIFSNPYWLAYSMSLVLIGSACYWLGYKLAIGHQFFKIYNRIFHPFWDYSVSHSRMLAGLIFGWIVKLILNYYNAIGHKVILVIERQGSIPPIIMRLKIFEDVSLLFMIVFMFLYYQNKRNKIYRNIFFAALAFEIIFAITSGARFPIVAVFLSVFFVDYFFSERLKVKWVMSGIVVLVMAMTVVAAYKEFVFNQRDTVAEVSNPFESIQMAIEYNNEQGVDPRMKSELRHIAYLAAVTRFNYVNEVAQMIRYKNVSGLSPRDPDFLTPFFTFPIFAVLPKYYLFGIPEESYGIWASKYLSGSTTTSIAISPVAFSYLAGGTAMVAIVFFILGILMKWASHLLLNVKGVIGFILILILIKYLVMFDSVAYSTYLNLIRYTILLPPVLWIAFRRQSH